MRAKVFPQLPQLKGLSALCVCTCARRLLLSAKVLAQTGHQKGFSPVWVRMWPCSSQGREKLLPQCGQLQPAPWVRRCMASAAGLLYSRPQVGQRSCCGLLLPAAVDGWVAAQLLPEASALRWVCRWRARLLLLE